MTGASPLPAAEEGEAPVPQPSENARKSVSPQHSPLTARRERQVFPSDVGRSFDFARDDTTFCHGFASIPTPTRGQRATIPGLPRNEEPPYPVILSGAAIGGAVEESFPSDVGRSFAPLRMTKPPVTHGGDYINLSSVTCVTRDAINKF